MLCYVRKRVFSKYRNTFCLFKIIISPLKVFKCYTIECSTIVLNKLTTKLTWQWSVKWILNWTHIHLQRFSTCPYEFVAFYTHFDSQLRNFELWKPTQWLHFCRNLKSRIPLWHNISVYFDTISWKRCSVVLMIS